MSPLAVTLVILVRTYDVFGVPVQDLDTARRAADETLRTAGIEAAWTTCRRGAVASLSSPRCLEPLASSEIMVRLIGAPDGSHDEATLGCAYVDTGVRRGVLASLYAARITALADRAGVDRGLLLGRALAHEIGHLLLGTSTHRPRGLMRALWTLEELRRSIEKDWLFSRLDIADIHMRLRDRGVMAELAGSSH